MVKDMKTKYCYPESLEKEDIKLFRKKMKMSQAEFAKFLCVSPKTVAHWEISDNEVKGPIVALYAAMISGMVRHEDIEVQPMTGDIRLYYMQGNFVSTVIDVNEREHFVTIKNYTKDIMARAFGINNSPTYEEYEEFLESRCIPKTRDKMKLYLKALNIPYYDPMLIIEKTEGRTSDDEFWIKIEKRSA